MLFADIGPGRLGLAAVYASGPNSYYAQSEWTVAAEYAYKATEKWIITPMAQYFGNYVEDTSNGAIPDSFDGLGDAWKVGITVDYQIADNLYAKATVDYTDPDDFDDVTKGFFRLQRSF